MSHRRRDGESKMYLTRLDFPAEVLCGVQSWPPRNAQGEQLPALPFFQGPGCPACHDRELREVEFCAWCWRAGWDALVPPAIRAEMALAQAKGTGKAVTKASRRLKGGKE